jgi:hypothetical protein
MPKDLNGIANLLQWEKGTEKCSIRLAAILMHGNPSANIEDTRENIQYAASLAKIS